MRSIAWTGFGAALGLPLLGIALGGGLAGGAGEALAQGMMGSSGYRSGGMAPLGYRAAPPPRYRFGPGAALKKGYAYGPAPRMRGYTYRPARPMKGYRAAPRAKRYYYRGPVAQKTCGVYHYWSTEKGRCLNARTSPPDLK